MRPTGALVRARADAPGASPKYSASFQDALHVDPAARDASSESLPSTRAFR